MTLDGLPVSYAQQQLWFLSQLAPDDTGYTVHLDYRLRGALDVAALRRALGWLVGRHAILRAAYHEVDGVPHQRFGPAADVALTVVDRAGTAPERRAAVAHEEVRELAARPFDLSTGPLFRFTLVRFADDDHVFSLTLHHSVVDGWSVGIIGGELAHAYRAFAGGTEPDLPEPAVTYLDYVAAQQAPAALAQVTDDLEYWAERLAGLSAVDLPADRPRPDGVSAAAAGDTVVDYPPEFAKELAALAERHGVSLFTLCAAAVGVVLSRYIGAEDVALGMPLLGRTDPDFEDVVGMFINMAVLRVDLGAAPRFTDLLEGVAEAALDVYDHQEAPFERVVDRVRPARTAGRNPLFQVSVQVLGAANSPMALALPGLAVEWLDPVTVHAVFDLNVTFFQSAAGLRLHVSYAADMFDPWRVEAFAGHVEQVLRAAAADPGRALADLDILTAAERERAVAGGSRRAYIVDAAGRPVPRGVPGTLLAGGDEEWVTATLGRAVPAGSEALPDPFHPGSVVHRGDMAARWTEDWRVDVLTSQGQPQTGPDGPAARAEAETVQASAAMPVSGMTPTEETLTGIMATVLGLPTVSLDANLFELGGSSLDATRVVSRIKKSFGVKVSVRLLYGDTTVKAIATAIDEVQSAGSAGA